MANKTQLHTFNQSSIFTLYKLFTNAETNKMIDIKN